MARLNLVARAMQSATHLHQTSAVVRDHYLGAALAKANHLVLQHRARDVRELDRKQTAEAAAFFAVAQFHDADSIYRRQKPQRLLAQAELAHQVARRVIGDGSFEARADV